MKTSITEMLWRKRKPWKRPVSKIAVLLFLLTMLQILGAADKKPDILFILVDDLRHDGMSFLGHPYVKTPNLDKMREGGAWMKNAFVSTSICCPSRATFLTGTYANRHGVIDNETAEINPEVTPPVSAVLREAGYHTSMIGKWHMGYSGRPRPYFDHWLSFDGQGKYWDPLFNIDGKKVKKKGYTTDLLTDHAISVIEKQPKDQPYFVMLSHKAVHEPFQPAKRHQYAFGKKTKDKKPYSYKDTFEGKPLWQRRQKIRDVRWNWRTRDFEKEVIPETITPEPWKESHKYVDQLRCLASVDDGLGRIMDMLKKRGTLNNTLIIFASDNGYFHREHQRWDKRLAYEESLRIPMLMYYPNKIKAQSTLDQMVMNLDFAPTVLDYAGAKIPEVMQGLSLKPILEGQTTNWRSSVFYEYWTELVHSIPSMIAVRDERYKLIQYPEIDDLDELYDLENDPHELVNLAVKPEYQPLHQKMLLKLKTAKTEAGWQKEVFPKNFAKVKGSLGEKFSIRASQGQMQVSSLPGHNIHTDQVSIQGDIMNFDGVHSFVKAPFHEKLDPSTWPFHLEVDVKVDQDGVIAAQSNMGYGFKLFVQDGRPAVSTLCKTWIASTTTIDATEVITGKWTNLKVLIHYNRLKFLVNDEMVESVYLPLTFKHPTKKPLWIGRSSKALVTKGTPQKGFIGQMKRFSISRKEISRNH